MATITTPETPSVVSRPKPSIGRRLHRAAARSFRPAGFVGAAILLIFIVMAVFAPVLAPHNPASIVGGSTLAPNGELMLGTDEIGRDILSNIIYGARVSLIVGLSVALTSLIAGSVVGGVAGYFGGRVDNALMRFAEFFQIMPGFVLALVIVAIFGQSLTFLIMALALAMWPLTARIVRAQVLTYRTREFVEAAKSQGFSHRFILFREILPNALAPALVQATLDVGTAVLFEAGLSFLGLGDPNRPSWGQMLNRAQPYLDQAWWMSVFPGAAIFLLVMAINLFGDALNDRMNPDHMELS